MQRIFSLPKPINVDSVCWGSDELHYEPRLMQRVKRFWFCSSSLAPTKVYPDGSKFLCQPFEQSNLIIVVQVTNIQFHTQRPPILLPNHPFSITSKFWDHLVDDSPLSGEFGLNILLIRPYFDPIGTPSGTKKPAGPCPCLFVEHWIFDKSGCNCRSAMALRARIVTLCGSCFGRLQGHTLGHLVRDHVPAKLIIYIYIYNKNICNSIYIYIYILTS